MTLLIVTCLEGQIPVACCESAAGSQCFLTTVCIYADLTSHILQRSKIR